MMNKTIIAGILLLSTPLAAFGFGAAPIPVPSDPVEANPTNPAPVSPSPAVPTPPADNAASNIPAPTAGSNFTACNNRSTAGDWSFGYAPAACNVAPAQSSAYATAQYSPVLFREGKANARKTYMSEMFPVAREIGTYYIKRRNPKVSAAEINGFLAGFYALLNQETFFTHYRLGADSITRYMRGDSLHGYGIMQVDDRSHSVALNQGKGVDLAENIIYGLDIYYAAWLKSATATCVSAASNYEQRARSAWAAYNGGPSSLCRWTNSSSAHAAKDTAYITKFRAAAWMTHVANANEKSALNVSCLAEGVRPCALLR